MSAASEQLSTAAPAAGLTERDVSPDGLERGPHAVAELIGGGQEMILHRGHDAAFS